MRSGPPSCTLSMSRRASSTDGTGFEPSPTNGLDLTILIKDVKATLGS